MIDSTTQDERLDQLVALAPPVGPLTAAALRTLLRPDATRENSMTAVAARCASSPGERRRARGGVVGRAA